MFVRLSVGRHIRAYCEPAKDYRDSVLSRIRGISDVNGKTGYTKADNTLWNSCIEIKLKADSQFTEIQKKVIEHDVAMKDGLLEITTHTALTRYILDAYNIHIHV